MIAGIRIVYVYITAHDKLHRLTTLQIMRVVTSKACDLSVEIAIYSRSQIFHHPYDDLGYVNLSLYGQLHHIYTYVAICRWREIMS